MAFPNHRTASDTAGSGSSAMAVRPASIDSMSAIATVKTTAVLAASITEMPIISRTDSRSFMARAIRSPVRRLRKYASGRRVRWAKKSSRTSASTCRDAPITTRRIRKRATPPTSARPTSSAA
ncbi:MAG: hypothetical protein BWZ09_02707 [Alphaproteobacteria bacterium ADurb.BinA305]|nr:MAG: hypothetical protein BWZ09_02707 [Alphaproteobacteria bacterium ADurb.BinA305]